MTAFATKFRLDVAGATHVGMRRSVNEDAFYLNDDLQLYMIADGMGGHKAGEVASRMALETIGEFLQGSQGGKDAPKTPQTDTTLSVDANRLLNGVLLANRSIYDLASQTESYEGMGSTLSAVRFTSDGVVLANVGDSPIFLIHQKDIQQLSVPHTVLAEHAALYPNGKSQLDETYGHMLTRAMGIEAEVLPDVSEIPCFPGDVLVIASDGLTQKVAPTEIMITTLDHKPARACQILIDLANQRGGDDNITVVIARVKSLRKFNGRLRSLWRSLMGNKTAKTDPQTQER